MAHAHKPSPIAYATVALLASIVLPTLQYWGRALDDNRLTSWQWVFMHVSWQEVSAALAVATIAAYCLSPRAINSPTEVFAIYLLSGALSWSIPEVIVDAARYFTQAKHLAAHGLDGYWAHWGRELAVWTDLPLGGALYGLMFRIFGEQRIWAQVLNTALFASAGVVLWRMGQELFDDEQVGRDAALMLLGVPYLYSQVPLMLVDVQCMCFLLFAAYGFLMALRHGGAGRMVLGAAAIVCAVLAKYSLWVMLSWLAAIALMQAARAPRQTLSRTASVAALAGVVLALLWWPKRDVVASQMALLVEYQRPGLARWGEGHLSTFFFQVHPFVSVAALCAALVAWRRHSWVIIVAAWPMLLLLVMDIQRIRYLLPAFPALALAGAYGLTLIADQRLRRFVVYAAVLTSIALAGAGYSPFLKVNNLVNLRDAARLIDALPGGPVVEVITLSQDSEINPSTAVPLLDLYLTKKQISYAPELVDQADMERMATSPFRFTWHAGLPEGYAKTSAPADAPLAVIGPGVLEPDDRRLGGRVLVRYFSESEGLFNYTPYVSVYMATRSGEQ